MIESIQQATSIPTLFAQEQSPPGCDEISGTFSHFLQDAQNRVAQIGENPKSSETEKGKVTEKTAEMPPGTNLAQKTDSFGSTEETDASEVSESLAQDEGSEKKAENSALSIATEIALNMPIDIRLVHPPDPVKPQLTSSSDAVSEAGNQIQSFNTSAITPEKETWQQVETDSNGDTVEKSKKTKSEQIDSSQAAQQTETPIMGLPFVQAEPTSNTQQITDSGQTAAQSGIQKSEQKVKGNAEWVQIDLPPPKSQVADRFTIASETKSEPVSDEVVVSTDDGTPIGASNEPLSTDKAATPQDVFPPIKTESSSSKPPDIRSDNRQGMSEDKGIESATAAAQMQNTTTTASDVEKAVIDLSTIGTLTIAAEPQGKRLIKSETESAPKIIGTEKSASKGEMENTIPIAITQTDTIKLEFQASSDAKGKGSTAEANQISAKSEHKEQQSPVSADRLAMVTENKTVQYSDIDKAASTDTSAYEPFTEQIAFHVSSALKKGDQTFTMKLSPEGLGELTVSMKLSDGNLSLELGATLEGTKHMLSDGISDLKFALQQSDIRVTNVTIKGEEALSSTATPFFSFRQNSGSGGRYVPQFETGQTRREIPFLYENGISKGQKTFSSGLLNYRI